MSEEKTEAGKFVTKGSLESEFPRVDIEKFRRNVLRSIETLKAWGHTGYEEQIEFDDHGLLVGSYQGDSTVQTIGLRNKSDIEEFMSKISEGKNFNARFEYDPETRKASIIFTGKRDELKSNLFLKKVRRE